MAILTKQQILDVDDRRYEEVAVPEWGGSVRLRALSGAEKDDFEASLLVESRNGNRERNLKNYRARLLSRVIVDADGKPLFDVGDIALLGRKSAKALDRVLEIAQKMNALRDEDVEGLVGNS